MKHLPLNSLRQRQSYGMGYDRYAAASPDDLNGLLRGLALPFDVAGGRFADVSFERVVRIGRVSLLDKNTREMRTTRHASSARFHLLECNVHSSFLQGLNQTTVACAPIFLLLS